MFVFFRAALSFFGTDTVTVPFHCSSFPSLDVRKRIWQIAAAAFRSNVFGDTL